MDHFAANRQILKRCITGEKKAREEFVIRFSNPVYQCIQFTLKAKQIPFSQQDLEDLHSTVFLNLFNKRCKKLRQYKGKNGCSVFSWIRLITVRTVIDHLRKAGRDVIVRPKEEFNLDTLPGLIHDGYDPLARLGGGPGAQLSAAPGPVGVQRRDEHHGHEHRCETYG